MLHIVSIYKTGFVNKQEIVALQFILLYAGVIKATTKV